MNLSKDQYVQREAKQKEAEQQAYDRAVERIVRECENYINKSPTYHYSYFSLSKSESASIHDGYRLCDAIINRLSRDFSYLSFSYSWNEPEEDNYSRTTSEVVINWSLKN